MINGTNTHTLGCHNGTGTWLGHHQCPDSVVLGQHRMSLLYHHWLWLRFVPWFHGCCNKNGPERRTVQLWLWNKRVVHSIVPSSLPTIVPSSLSQDMHMVWSHITIPFLYMSLTGITNSTARNDYVAGWVHTYFLCMLYTVWTVWTLVSCQDFLYSTTMYNIYIEEAIN